MARLSATRKYRDTNTTIYEHYINQCNINTHTFEFECNSKIVDELGNVIAEANKGDKLKIICRDPILINGKFHVSICHDVNVGYVLISNIRKPYLSGRQYNKGEIAEGLLTIAIAAKILKYNVTMELLKNMILNFNLISDEALEYKENHVYSVVKLNKNAIINLRDVTNHTSIEMIYQSIINFIKTEYILRFYNDVDVSVKSIGFNGDKNVKADIILSSNTKDLYISLKCGNTKNLEQAGTSQDSIKRVMDSFGLYYDTEMLMYEKSVTWYLSLFERVISDFNMMCAFKRHYHLAYGIINSTTRHSKNTIHLHLKEDLFEICEYNNLFVKLNCLNISAKMDTKVKNPKIIFEDSLGTPIISFYLETRDGGRRLTLHILKEKLLSQLTVVDC